MLRQSQVRRLVFMGFLLVAALAMLLLYPQYRKARERTFREAGEAVEETKEAPPPPPSPFSPGAVIFDGMLRSVIDYTPPAELDKERAYFKLLTHVATLTDAAMGSASEGPVTYETFLRYAGELRGRVFRVKGRAIYPVDARRLPEPVRGRQDVYELFLWDYENDGGFTCHLVEKPELIEKGDDVELEGLFYKVVRFKNKQGKDRDTPLLITRTVRRLAPDLTSREGLSTYEILLAVGIAGVLAAGFFVSRKMARTRYPRLLRRPRRPGGQPSSPSHTN